MLEGQRIKDLPVLATEEDLEKENFLPIDGDGGTKKLPINLVGGIQEAPDDGKSYARKNKQWAEVQIEGVATEEYVDDKVKEESEARKEDYDNLEKRISGIQAVIPNDTTVENSLVNKNYVDNSLEQVSARYLSADSDGNPFTSYSSFVSGPYYYDGLETSPTKNDYVLVNGDEQHENAVTRYWYTGNNWSFQYIVNNTSFTKEQLDAINSGITAEKVAEFENKLDAISHDDTISGEGTEESPLSVNEMEGASDSEGKKGLVPAPSKADSLLAGDGLWKNLVIIGKDDIDTLDWDTRPTVRIGDNDYPYVKIGNLLWTAKNLNEDFATWKYANDDESLADKYGRYYLAISIDQWDGYTQAFKDILPDGWRLPTLDDFNALIDGNTSDAAWHSRASSLMDPNGFDMEYLRPYGYVPNNALGLSLVGSSGRLRGSWVGLGHAGVIMGTAVYRSAVYAKQAYFLATGVDWVVRVSYESSETLYLPIRLCKDA